MLFPKINVAMLIVLEGGENDTSQIIGGAS
jgi:hypothetical protein